MNNCCREESRYGCQGWGREFESLRPLQFFYIISIFYAGRGAAISASPLHILRRGSMGEAADSAPWRGFGCALRHFATNETKLQVALHRKFGVKHIYLQRISRIFQLLDREKCFADSLWYINGFHMANPVAESGPFLECQHLVYNSGKQPLSLAFPELPLLPQTRPF